MGLFDNLLPGGLAGGYTQAPMTTAGKYLFDQTQNLGNQTANLPTNKVLFGGNTFEVLPKAEKDRIKLQLAILGALSGTQQNQTIDPGLLGRLAPALGLAAGSKLFGGGDNTGGGLLGWMKNLFSGNTGNTNALNIMDSGGLASGLVDDGADWGDLSNIDWSMFV